MPSAADLRRLAFAALLALTGSTAWAQTSIHYATGCESPGWERIFRAFGLSPAQAVAEADILVVCAGAQRFPSRNTWNDSGKILIIESNSAIAESFGFVSSEEPPVEIRSVRDRHNPDLLIVWKEAQRLNPTRLPEGAKVLAEDRWTGTPLVASFRTERGPLLWLAISPGDNGYSRFPFLGSALLDAGFVPPLRARSLWAFFDSAYRQRVDLHYIARRWREYGIAALHVSAWQHWERDTERDAWLRALIDACHRQGILVYAWFEFPHVSEQFWAAHPECREKTALGQDAHLDWRKLINLSDPACAEPIREQARALLRGFDWDGANLAEIYYESLEGPANPARFTPMNGTIRRQFEQAHGFDPAALFDTQSPRHLSRNPNGLRAFLDFRRKSIGALHAEWLRVLSEATDRPLHLVVTQIDDRFDPSVRDNLGADSAEILSLMHEFPFTFLVEDPATIWHLGPSRYQDIANAYAGRTPYPERLAIDINIFPRYQEVYPTRRQTGIELYQLVNRAARAFPRVALYFEHTLSAQDLPLLASAAVPGVKLRRAGESLMVETQHTVGLRWKGPALVNGRAWAARGGEVLWLPPGRHRVEAGQADPLLRLIDLNGELRQIHSSGRSLELHYHSASRAIATFSEMPRRLWVDGNEEEANARPVEGGYAVALPPGEHVVRVESGGGEISSQ